MVRADYSGCKSRHITSFIDLLQWYAPTSQSVRAATSFIDLLQWYVPTSQGVRAATSFIDLLQWYVPTSQGVRAASLVLLIRCSGTCRLVRV